jgi:hypothetical protein
MIELSPPPKFSGTDKKVIFSNWWRQIIQFLDSQPAGAIGDDKRKISWVSTRLEAEAETWYWEAHIESARESNRRKRFQYILDIAGYRSNQFLFLDKTKKDDRTTWSWLLGPPEDGTMRMVVDIFQLVWVLAGVRRGRRNVCFPSSSFLDWSCFPSPYFLDLLSVAFSWLSFGGCQLALAFIM